MQPLHRLGFQKSLPTTHIQRRQHARHTHTLPPHTTTASRSGFLPNGSWARYPNNGIFLIIPAPDRPSQPTLTRTRNYRFTNVRSTHEMSCFASPYVPSPILPDCSGLCLALVVLADCSGYRTARRAGTGPKCDAGTVIYVAVAVC